MGAPVSSKDREEMVWLCSSVNMLRVAAVLSVRSSAVGLQEEGNGKAQGKRIAACFKASVWGASYQDPAHPACQGTQQVIHP